MKTNLNHLKTTSSQILSLVNRNPRIILASLIISIVSLIGRMTDWPALSLFVSLVLFSWGYVEVDLLHQAKKSQKIIWTNVPKKIGVYLKKTWPLIAIGLILLILVIPLFINLYLMQNSGSLPAFLASTISSPLFILIIDALTTIFSLWFVQSMVILVVDDQPVLKSLKSAGQYLIKNFKFILTITIILSIFGILARALIEISPFIIATKVAYLLFSAYLGLLIKSALLTNYLK